MPEISRLERDQGGTEPRNFKRNRRRGTDYIENLQLLCGHCNSVKGDRQQEYLVARLRELGIAA